MAEEKLLRIEGLRHSWLFEYFPDYGESSKERFLLGFFDKEEAINVLDEFIGPYHYDWLVEPDACDDQNAAVIRLRSRNGLYNSDRLHILSRSLNQPNLTASQSAELILEMARLGEQLKYVCSDDRKLIGCFPAEYAEGRWGKLKRDKVSKRSVSSARFSEESRFILLSSQLMAPNHDCLSLRQQHDIAAALKSILMRWLHEEGHLAPDAKEVFRRALSYSNFEYPVTTKGGSFVGYFTELQVFDNWSDYVIDGSSKTITLTVELSDEERKSFLLEQLANDQLSDATYTLGLVNEIGRLGLDADERVVLAFADRKLPDNKPLLSGRPQNPDWRSLFKRVRDYYATFEHDYVAASMVLKQLRSHFGGHISEGHLSFLQRAIADTGSNTVEVDGRAFNAPQILNLALIGHQGATEALATILLQNAERSAGDRRFRRDEQHRTSKSNIAEDAIPEWARPQRSAIEEWALKTRSLGYDDGADGVGSFIASQVGKGKLNVLVFESELYEEIRGAEIVGDRTIGIESFPFPMAVVPLRESASILGVAVFKLDELPSTVNAGQQHKGKFGSAYLLKNGGVTLTPEPSAIEVGDRLITYLDCESVQFDTAYVDGGTRTRKNAPSVATDAAAVKYARGSDFNTGTRIVVERERPKRIAGGAIGTRRSHFRRGFFRRQRVGTRDDWHYETRWIKPMFVHGTQAIVTERKVKRIVL